MKRRVRRSEARKRGGPRARVTARDVMSRDVISVSPDLPLREAIELFAREHLTGAPVVAGTRVIGVVSANDILTFQATLAGVPRGRPEMSEEESEEVEPVEAWREGGEPPGAYFSEAWTDAGADLVARYESSAQPEWDVLTEHTVEEAMSYGVRSVPPGASLGEVAEYLLAQGIHRALVMEGEELLGIVTPGDILRAVAAGRLR